MDIFSPDGPLPEGWGLEFNCFGIGGAKTLIVNITSELNGKLILSQIQFNVTPSAGVGTSNYLALGGHTIKSIIIDSTEPYATQGSLYCFVYVTNGFTVSNFRVRCLVQGAITDKSPLCYPVSNRSPEFDLVASKFQIVGNGGAGAAFTYTWQGPGYIKIIGGTIGYNCGVTVGNRTPNITIYSDASTLGYFWETSVACVASTNYNILFVPGNDFVCAYSDKSYLIVPPVWISYNGSVVINAGGIKGTDQFVNSFIFCEWLKG